MRAALLVDVSPGRTKAAFEASPAVVALVRARARPREGFPVQSSDRVVTFAVRSSASVEQGNRIRWRGYDYEIRDVRLLPPRGQRCLIDCVRLPLLSPVLEAVQDEAGGVVQDETGSPVLGLA